MVRSLEALLVTAFISLFAKFLAGIVSVQLSFAGISEDVVSVHVKWDISVSECYVVCFRGYIISNKSYKKKLRYWR